MMVSNQFVERILVIWSFCTEKALPKVLNCFFNHIIIMRDHFIYNYTFNTGRRFMTRAQGCSSTKILSCYSRTAVQFIPALIILGIALILHFLSSQEPFHSIAASNEEKKCMAEVFLKILVFTRHLMIVWSFHSSLKR